MSKKEIFEIIKTFSSARAPSGLEKARGELLISWAASRLAVRLRT